jgi:hypothetical protein
MEPMSGSNYRHPGNEGTEPAAVRHDEHSDPRPYWKRAHHDFRFWIGMILMLAAITIYVMSDDLSLLPRGQSHVTLPGTIGK